MVFCFVLTHLLGLSAAADEPCKKIADELNALEQRDEDPSLKPRIDELRQALKQCDEGRPARIKAMVAKIEAKPEAVRLALSVNLCSSIEDRNGTLEEIATEKKYSRIAGVIRLQTMDRLRSDLQETDEKIASLRQDLKSRHLSPLSCRSAQVKAIVDCLYDDAPSYCEDEFIAALKAFIRGDAS